MANIASPVLVLMSLATGSFAVAVEPSALLEAAKVTQLLDNRENSSGLASASLNVGDRGSLIVIQSSARTGGFFYVDIDVNTVPTRFLVDTGSNVTVLRATDARNAGLEGRGKLWLRTVGKDVAASRTSIASLALSGSTIANQEAVIVSDELVTSLIGTDTLAQLGPIVLNSGQITIRSQTNPN